jgi:hypothetical protein
LAKKDEERLAAAKEQAGSLVAQLEPKTYKSQKTGFYAQGKLTIDGERYQSQVMLVKIEKKD